ncbi:MAG: hypothetical protein AAFQ89_13450 [Cyanobacteria bacterium J06626_18]
MDRITQQFGRVSELITSADTRATYAKTLTLTWGILRETGILLWLVLCLLFVGADLFWKISVGLGLRTRAWYEDTTKGSKNNEPKSFGEIGKSVASSLGSGAETLLYQAKQQLGMDPSAPALKPASPSTTTPPPAGTAAPAKATDTASTVEATAVSTDKANTNS